MIDLEYQAFTKYKKNLEYFEKNHFQLFQKLSTLEIAINSAVYQENYSLEYKNEGYFDIQELSSGNFLYGENSKIYSEKLASTINYHRTGSVFEGQQRFPIKKEELEEIGDFKNFHSSLWATAQIVYFNAKIAPKASSEMQKLYKFIFLETGLGFHIEYIIKKYNISVAFIFEKNLEIFRLSLFTIDYAELSNKTMFFFSIMDTFDALQYTFTSFLNEQFNHNLYIKYLPFSNHYDETLHDLQSITLSQNHILYPYQAYMARSFNAIEKISQGKCFFNIAQTYTHSPLSSKPILVLASGPSLQNNTQWIQKHQEHFLTIAVLSACKHLLHHDIIPDVIVHIDPQEISLSLIEGLDLSKLERSTFIFGSSVHPKVIEKLSNIPIIFIEEATSFKVGHGFFTLPSIGEYATILPLILGAKEIYILGVDLALNPNTMKDHIDLHIASKHISHNHDQDSVEFQNSLCYVKGNFLDRVPSKPNFRLSLTQFHKAILRYKQDHQTVYNLSNGAYLEGTIPLHVNDIEAFKIPLLSKETLSHELSVFLKAHSSCEFRNIDREHIQKQRGNSVAILRKMKELRQITPKEPENYLFRKLIPFVQEISEMDRDARSDLGEILFEYFKITLSFIFDTCNTKSMKDSKKYHKELDNLVLDEVEKVVSTYDQKLREYLSQ
ncbi:motility associated factor glycosyltransferase family protein [Sulfurospirillum cavolei]|uniref:motility associated factor glycosyltransferase family protein n=1 Tax=Sulfurospirillum cavolei TaxID=366522 RepID=UPI003FA1DB53